MKRGIVLTTLIVVGALSMAVAGFQGQPAAQAAGQAAGAGRGRGADVPKVAELEKVRDTLYLLKGGGGNTAVFITDLGVVVIDTKLAGWGQPMMEKIKTITKKPVVTLINTHAHGDHTGSNEFFGTAVEIVAQENTRLNMDKMPVFKGDKVNYLPKLMFKEKMSLSTGKDKIDLYYFGAGHTSGDAFVVFPALRLMHAGDMFAGKTPPLIDTNNGGSGLAYPDSLAKAASSIKNVDTIITGHAATMMMWPDLQEYAQFNKEFRDAVLTGYHHGLSIDEVASAWTLSDKYKGYTAQPARVKANVLAIFGELTKP